MSRGSAGPRLTCVRCGGDAPPYALGCPDCGGLLDVATPLHDLDGDTLRRRFADRLADRLAEAPPGVSSGVWRYAELVHPWATPEQRASMGEGNTPLAARETLSVYAGVEALQFKHEGANPTGSFKDRGMCVGVTEALRQDARAVACASTGNTSASMAAYAAAAGMQAVVLIPEGKIALGKLAQALAYGARVLQVDGNFDEALRILRETGRDLGLYLLNSVNPWRIEGQKAIMLEMLQQRGWRAPDWVAVPAGNLGNTSAFGKALREALDLGLIDRMPRVAAVQASGAAPFRRLWQALQAGGTEPPDLEPERKPETVATAIRIGNPVSWRKALRTIRDTGGTVTEVDDTAIMDAKAAVDAAGLGCEPASAASLAGVKRLVAEGVIRPDQDVVCVLTGHLLKDPDAVIAYHTGHPEAAPSAAYVPARPNRPRRIAATAKALEEALNWTTLENEPPRRQGRQENL